ncbi:MAG: ABC transporter permease [Candidatus Omnitrophica bacterium]|nr:ABC transporter permease [Candidatus Omnitrophota bacterium]
MIKFSIKNILTRRRRSLTSLAGISISIALFISVILILRSAQEAFRKPLQEAGSDMVVQLQGEPCVWAIVKLPTDLNPIPFKFIDKIRSLDEVIAVEASLITWAFPLSSLPSQALKTQDPSGFSHQDAPLLKEGAESAVAPCETGPVGSFCATDEAGGIKSNVSSNFSPIVVVGVNPEPGELGPIKKSDLKDIQGRYFTKQDNLAVILDKDFARTRNLKLEDSIDIGPRLNNKVIGIIDPGYEAKIAGAQVFVPLKVAMEMAGRGDIVDIVFVKLKGGVNTELVKQKIKKALGNDDVTITTSKDYLSSVAGFSLLAQRLMLAIFFIVILISFLFIAKTVFGATLERSSEIGTLKATGWRNKDIIKLIVLENSILGFIGGLLGSLLGYLTSFIYKVNLPSALPYYLNPYPPCSQHLVKNTLQGQTVLPLSIFLLTILLAVIIQGLSSLLATIRILKLTPVDATRRL